MIGNDPEAKCAVSKGRSKLNLSLEIIKMYDLGKVERSFLPNGKTLLALNRNSGKYYAYVLQTDNLKLLV